jgi:RNA polymerase sigma factor (sigma-70 family)
VEPVLANSRSAIDAVEPSAPRTGATDGPPAGGNYLAAALAGDAKAWDRIVNDHSKLLWWVARSYRLDDATAADVVQTVWLQLIRFGDRIQDPARLAGWLSTTARRECIRRVSSRQVPADWIDDEPDRLAASPDETILDAEALDIVLAAFSRLSTEDQNLLRLICDVPPKSYEEIAALLGRSPGYIGPTRQRALNKLRALVREMGLT